MHRRFLGRTTTFALSIAVLALTACSTDSAGIDPSAPLTAKSGSTAPGDSTPPSGNPTGPTSTGPVASVLVTPHTATLPLGYFLPISAVGLDANGVQVADARATYRSSNPAIVAVVLDTGAIKAVALGTAKVYATINGHTDSAAVTVVEAPPEATPTPPTPGIASFDFNGTIVAPLAGTDTSKTTPVAGALVKLSKVGGVTGDTLETSVDAGSATTDASGKVSFKGLAGGAYVVDITPPAGSSLSAFKSGFAPPHDAVVNFTFKLFAKP